MEEMIEIIESVELIMGLSDEQARQLRNVDPMVPFAFYQEMPAHPVTVKPFRIDQTPVTNADYLKFVEAGGYEEDRYWKELLAEPELDGRKVLGTFTDQSGRPGPLTWSGGRPRAGTDNHPVSGVSWFEAQAYCRFRGVRLPREAEWELAARGSDGRMYPWGNEFDPARCQHDAKGGRTTVPVSSFPNGSSPYGLLHAVGNVAQWCEERFAPYPGSKERGDQGPLDRILRGDFYSATPLSLRTTVRSPQSPECRFPGLGFRCAADPE